jgi:hypothetical protein
MPYFLHGGAFIKTQIINASLKIGCRKYILELPSHVSKGPDDMVNRVTPKVRRRWEGRLWHSCHGILVSLNKE